MPLFLSDPCLSPLHRRDRIADAVPSCLDAGANLCCRQGKARVSRYYCVIFAFLPETKREI
jgi:hypothetical protein